MKFRLSNLFWAACLAVTLLVQASVIAQEDASKPASQRKASQPAERPKYDISIGHGVLNGGEHATIDNIVRLIRDSTHAENSVNIIVAPGAGEITIADLKLRSASLDDVMEALAIASGGMVHASRLSTDSWAIASRQPFMAPSREVEVFNVSNYLQTFTKEEDKAKALDEVQVAILDIYKMLSKANGNKGDEPSFRFHPGASLFIVIGSREALDIAKKVVTALPGQRTVPEKAKPTL